MWPCLILTTAEHVVLFRHSTCFILLFLYQNFFFFVFHLHDNILADVIQHWLQHCMVKHNERWASKCSKAVTKNEKNEVKINQIHYEYESIKAIISIAGVLTPPCTLPSSRSAITGGSLILAYHHGHAI